MRRVGLRRHIPALLATTFLVSCGAVVVNAVAGEGSSSQVQTEIRYSFDIAAKPLLQALRDISQVSGLSMAVNRSEAMMLVGIMGRPVRGKLTVDEALAALTARTGVQYRRDDARKFTIVPPLSPAARAANAQDVQQLDTITVRGTTRKRKRTTPAAPPPVQAPAPAIATNAGGDIGYHPESMSSATKTNTPLRDIPQSIAVVTKQQVQDIGAQRLEDVAHYVPGVNWHQGEGNRDQLVIRGQSSTADFFVNGMRDDGQVFRDLYNTERIEFLKGPNAMIFGRGGGGGVLNRVLKQADGVRVNEWKVQSGSYSNARVSGDVGGKITDTLYGRINGVFEDSDSYRDYFHMQRGGINPRLTWLATPGTKVKLSYEYFHDYRTADRGIPSQSGHPFAGASPNQFFGNPLISNTSLTQSIATAVVDHDFNNGLTVKNQTRFAAYQHDYQNVYPGSAVNPATNTYTLSAYNNSNDRQNLMNQTDWT
jgi:outer membrane receptor for monomeric catechols